MMNIKFLSVFTGLCLICGAVYASCPVTDNVTITQISYDTADYFPKLKLSSQPAGGNTWLTFGKSYGVNTVWGRTMLAIALGAVTKGNKVDVVCSNDDITSITARNY